MKEVCSKTFQEQRGANSSVSKLLRNKEEQTEAFLNFVEAKRNKLRCSKTFQKQRGTNRVVPKFSGAKRNKKKDSKAF